METENHLRLRNKREVAQDMERTRAIARDLIEDTKYTFVDRNPGVRAWRKTARAVRMAKDKVVAGSRAVSSGAKQTHHFVQSSPYRAMAVALGVGTLVGFLSTRKRKDFSNCW